MAKISLVFLVICLGLIHSGFALKCYSCSSAKVAECDEIDPSNTKIPLNECQASNNMEIACVKYEVEDKSNSKMNVTRMCMTFQKGSEACERVKQNNPTIALAQCGSCIEDGCNSAVSIQTSVFTILSLCIVAFLGNRS